MFGQQAQGQQVVGLAAAHRLAQLKDALRRLTFQASKALFEQGLHAVGDEVLGKERLGADPAGDQIGQVEHRVAALGVKNAGARLAELLQRFHALILWHSVRAPGRWAPNWQKAASFRRGKPLRFNCTIDRGGRLD